MQLSETQLLQCRPTGRDHQGEDVGSQHTRYSANVRVKLLNHQQGIVRLTRIAKDGQAHIQELLLSAIWLRFQVAKFERRSHRIG